MMGGGSFVVSVIWLFFFDSVSHSLDFFHSFTNYSPCDTHNVIIDNKIIYDLSITKSAIIPNQVN